MTGSVLVPGIKTHAKDIGLPANWQDNFDIAVLATMMGVPKEGPSASISGVLPKLQAAIDAGCTEVIMPKENERDVQMTPEYVRDKIKVRFVSSIEEVLEAALL